MRETQRYEPAVNPEGISACTCDNAAPGQVAVLRQGITEARERLGLIIETIQAGGNPASTVAALRSVSIALQDRLCEAQEQERTQDRTEPGKAA